jgi:hypothetical protein
VGISFSFYGCFLFLRRLVRGLFLWGFFGDGLKGAHGLGPHLVEVGAEAGDAFGIELIETAGSLAGAGDEARVFEDFEVLGDGGAGDGELAGQLIDGDGAGGELLKDGHSGLVAEGVETGL